MAICLYLYWCNFSSFVFPGTSNLMLGSLFDNTKVSIRLNNNGCIESHSTVYFLKIGWWNILVIELRQKLLKGWFRLQYILLMLINGNCSSVIVMSSMIGLKFRGGDIGSAWRMWMSWMSGAKMMWILLSFSLYLYFKSEIILSISGGNVSWGTCYILQVPYGIACCK